MTTLYVSLDVCNISRATPVTDTGFHSLSPLPATQRYRLGHHSPGGLCGPLLSDKSVDAFGWATTHNAWALWGQAMCSLRGEDKEMESVVVIIWIIWIRALPQRLLSSKFGSQGSVVEMVEPFQGR